MEYRKIELISNNLHLINTNKFKMIFFKFVFRNEINKHEITLRNLLLDNLVTTTLKYPTKRLMNIKKQELYDLSIYAGNRRIGNYIASEICFSLLDNKYTEENTLQETIDFMKEVLFNPNVKNNAFEKDNFNVRKNIIQENIISIKNYPKYLSVLKMKEYMDNTKSFSYNMDGYIEDLNIITPKTLYDYYKKFLNNSLIDIYVVGSFDMYEMEKLIKDNFIFKTIKKQKRPIIEDYIPKEKTPKIIMDDSFFNQSRLVLGMFFKNLTDKEKRYVLFLYNMILGNSANSKLFKNVREKKSLTYDISSNYSKSDNILIITTGIEKEKYDEAVSAIKYELKEMVKGTFTEDDLNNSKEMIISIIRDFEEYPNSICEYYFNMDYLDYKDIETSIALIKKITKQDIMNVAKKIKIDTIYLLKEEQHENN